MPLDPERRNPFLKFFHTDWQADEALQECSLAARGLWLEMILYMHKAEPYGHLLINGRVPTNDDLMRRVRPRSKKEFTTALAELRENRVYSVTDNGVIFCRRMVRAADRVRTSRENGQLGGAFGHLGGRPAKAKKSDDQTPTITPSETPNVTPTKTPLEARSQKLEARSQKLDRGGRDKRPIFTGQRLTVFAWFLDKAERILGPHFEDFDIHEWFYAVDKAAVASGAVIPQRDNGAWLETQLMTEIRRRRLPTVSATPSENPYESYPTAWTCKVCGEIHEGTQEQGRTRPCLKKAS